MLTAGIIWRYYAGLLRQFREIIKVIKAENADSRYNLDVL